ncbi:hypothetical protein [Actinomadura macrotermitis]|uniref:Uncharacterized protein n=1 Tax=Actinomadura macrotermitis TaxID=2585200 RepID=A0A7K0BSR8_9ACTN|nr:hypothetical protein [Actinomadura macrotermitis]MQY04197.1 hypothetical protein [Actinomadura macrotermitis]
MTTTVVLVLLCLAIAGRELYLASDKRLPRAQAELRELRAQVAELTRRHEALQAKIAAPAEDPAEAPSGPPAAVPVTDEPPAVAGDPRALERVDALTDRVDRLEKDFAELAAQLDALDLDRDAQRALARSLDVVEHDIGELHAEMLDRLARSEGLATGLLLSEEGEADALLSEAYEGCAAGYGLRVRIRDQRVAKGAGGDFWGTAYHLSGRRPDELAEELFGHARDMTAPQEHPALGALLTELAQLRGGGVARIGPFTAVRTASGFLCGLLPDDAADAAEPWELAAQVRELPADLRCDLSRLRATD